MTNESPFPRTIVGVDGSPPSRAALRWAAARAAPDGAPLVLAYVASPEDESGVGDTLLADAASLVRSEHPELAVEELPLVGAAWRELSRAAGADDRLVIGTHKTGLAHGRVTGSLALRLALATRAEFVVVPDLDLRFRRGVVAGIGGAGTAGPVALAAAAEARRMRAPLTLVHGSCPRRCDDALDAAERAVTGDPERAGDAPTITRRSLSSPAADALLDAALDKQLLVLGAGGRGRAAGAAPIGALTHDVLMNANAPILLLAPAPPQQA
ncbi:universal stress protein [Microbacterium sp. NPDC096154]|uniref:universal stress protein n=1 Tax=Microbacterium sp. NPDC096154 TaxID=3155549 RepID=UPI0033323194